MNILSCKNKIQSVLTQPWAGNVWDHSPDSNELFAGLEPVSTAAISNHKELTDAPGESS